MNVDPTPVLPHISSEFYLWLWYESERCGGHFDLPAPVGEIVAFVSDRVAFRHGGEKRVSALMTGPDASTSLESRAALAGGKVLAEIQLSMRRNDRDFQTTLAGPEMHLRGAKLPSVLSETEEEKALDRKHAYDELCLMIAGLFETFAAQRAQPSWATEMRPALVGWIDGQQTR